MPSVSIFANLLAKIRIFVRQNKTKVAKVAKITPMFMIYHNIYKI